MPTIEQMEREHIAEMFNESRTALIRTFAGGATRNSAEGKIQWFGSNGRISTPALRAYGEYMKSHRMQEDGKLRNYNNWRQGEGIPQDVCMDSLGRHMLDLADLLEGREIEGITVQEAACAVIFNAFSILDVELKK